MQLRDRGNSFLQ